MRESQTKRTDMNGANKPYGMIAEYTTAASVMHAAEKVRDAGYRKWDVFTPFPVHGMDRAMGLRNSKVGWFAFLGGVPEYPTGFLLFGWLNPVNSRIVIGVKRSSTRNGPFRPSSNLRF